MDSLSPPCRSLPECNKSCKILGSTDCISIKAKMRIANSQALIAQFAWMLTSTNEPVDEDPGFGSRDISKPDLTNTHC
ncbi:hypothetical protein BDQ94DRAFT_145936 [Aspergillus welwitschiae]|uniref:Uncharacterized protein n=1 Tax=Aspergillus welwitschiae TaxID=1341132 RepID=A0A3F3PYF1_9EURO|nr:hypothetical protein BDQ94DRAFT_145936 [Aspergillus welwitschiae]RDH31877.1 hypothetical protein BDQ94DRAFT_145936 [Aspergillus welwitschiae]